MERFAKCFHYINCRPILVCRITVYTSVLCIFPYEDWRQQNCPRHKAQGLVVSLCLPGADNISANYRKLKPEQKCWPSNNQTHCNQYFSKQSFYRTQCEAIVRPGEEYLYIIQPLDTVSKTIQPCGLLCSDLRKSYWQFSVE